jgi:prevent-host-death family protein
LEMSYNVKEAKDNLSSIIRLAEKGQPQIIRRHDKEVAVVVSIEDWKKAHGEEETFLEFLQRSGLREILPYLERSNEPVREFTFE